MSCVSCVTTLGYMHLVFIVDYFLLAKFFSVEVFAVFKLDLDVVELSVYFR